MKSWTVILIVLGICACLKAPHDHPFDPNNPDKAYIGGTVYKYDGSILSNVDIKLYYHHDSTIYDETKSDAAGEYYFEDVDPGIYMLIAKYGYYAPCEIIPCSLPAETYIDTADLWLGHMFFPFEEENLGTIAPRAFNVIQGNWVIANDPSDPEKHTVPRVYTGNVSGMNAGVAMIDEWLRNFSVDAKIKIMDWPAEAWNNGLLFRYQNIDNYYAANINHHRLSLIRKQGGVVTPLAVDSFIVFLPNEWYCLSVYCCEDSLHLLVDGERKLSAADGTFSEGYFALWVANNDTTETTVFFDDIDIWP